MTGPACGGLIMTLKLPSFIASGTSALNHYMTSCSIKYGTHSKACHLSQAFIGMCIILACKLIFMLVVGFSDAVLEAMPLIPQRPLKNDYISTCLDLCRLLFLLDPAATGPTAAGLAQAGVALGYSEWSHPAADGRPSPYRVTGRGRVPPQETQLL